MSLIFHITCYNVHQHGFIFARERPLKETTNLTKPFMCPYRYHFEITFKYKSKNIVKLLLLYIK